MIKFISKPKEVSFRPLPSSTPYSIQNSKTDIKPSFNRQQEYTVYDEGADYEIIYINQNDQYLISISGSPFEEKRKLAEQNFLKTFKINKEEACKLNVVITTPTFANPKEAGINYKLSFCD